MDIVYVYKRWPKNWIELRYSLRSLQNIYHKNVFIVWDKPIRSKNIIHIKADDIWNKFNNVINKYKIICKDDRISDDFILMHDDNYILKSIKKVETYKRWTLKEHADIIYKKFWDNMYYKSIKAVYDMFPDWDSFDVHCPVVYNKKRFKEIIDKYWTIIWSKRSIYHNYFNIKGIQYNNKDCKIFKNNIDINEDWLFLSSDDSVVKDKRFIDFIDNRFPNKSEYEILNINDILKMKFKAKPNYVVCVGEKMVKFNTLGVLETEDAEVIKVLSANKNIEGGEVVEPTAPVKTEQLEDAEVEPTEKPLEEYTNKELKAMCEDKGLDVSKATKKADFVALLTE